MSWVVDGRAPALGRGRASALHAVGRGVALLRVAKPRIVALFALTVLVASVLAGPAAPALTVAIVASAALTVAGAAALNNYLERELDARMTRTRRRPTADGTLAPRGGAGLRPAGHRRRRERGVGLRRRRWPPCLPPPAPPSTSSSTRCSSSRARRSARSPAGSPGSSPR